MMSITCKDVPVSPHFHLEVEPGYKTLKLPLSLCCLLNRIVWFNNIMASFLPFCLLSPPTYLCFCLHCSCMQKLLCSMIKLSAGTKLQQCISRTRIGIILITDHFMYLCTCMYAYIDVPYRSWKGYSFFYSFPVSSHVK